MSSCTQLELLEACSKVSGAAVEDIAVFSTYNEELLQDSRKWCVVGFRPCVSKYFTSPVPFGRIRVAMKAFDKSPWASCLMERKQHPAEDTTLSYIDYENKNRQMFRIQKLKDRASQAFVGMRHRAATSHYEHGTAKNNNAVLQASRNGDATQVVTTPSSLLETLNNLFNFDCDPCPIKPQDDAMTTEWGMMNFVNPPFKHTAAFCFRAVEMAVKKDAKTVVICPATIRSVWRYELHKTGAVHAYVFLRSGIRFDGYTREMPLPMNLILIGTPRTQREEVPCFFWDATNTCRRRKPSVYNKDPPNLKAIGW